MVALRCTLVLGLSTLLLSAPAPVAADHPFQRYRSTYGVWNSNPLHPAYPVSSGVMPTFTEQWYLLQPGWGIPTMNKPGFHGASGILDMSQPLFQPGGKPPTDVKTPPSHQP